MIRVALETSTAAGSVAVGRDDEVLAEVELGSQRRHAESILPALDEALKRAGLGRSGIGGVVVGGGPGSFTGVRVAAATAKGLAAALERPLLAYPSLLALAVGVACGGEPGGESGAGGPGGGTGGAAGGARGVARETGGTPICALFDARRGEVYAGCWMVDCRGGGLSVEELLAPVVGPIDEVLRRLASHAPLYAGDGADRHTAAIDDAGGFRAAPAAHPRAASLLRLAHHQPGLGRVEDAAAWEPEYARASSAERGIRG